MIDLEGDDAVKRCPPSEKVVEEIAVGLQLGQGASTGLGVVDSDRSQNIGLRGHCRTIGGSGVPADLVEEDEIELARMLDRPGPVGNWPRFQALLERRSGRLGQCSSDVGLERLIALDDQLGQQLGQAREVGVERGCAHSDLASDPAERDRAQPTVLESPPRFGDDVLLEFSTLPIASAFLCHRKHATLNTVKMSSGVKERVIVNRTVGVTLDCVDVKTAALFWKAALEYDEPTPWTDGAQFHALVSPNGGLHHLTLQRVAEAKAGKNRVHLDIFVDDLDSEVARLVGLGARTLEEHDDEGGYRTVILTDPLGNEFCLVQR